METNPGPTGASSSLRTHGNVLFIVMYDFQWTGPEAAALFADPAHPDPRIADAIAALP